MITPNRFLDAVKGKPGDPRREQKNFDGSPRLFRLAVVDPAWDGSGWPKVTFEEEDVLTTKQYPYAGVSPGPGQRVVLARIGGTDVILGAISEATATGGGYMPAGAPILYTSSGTFAKANYPGIRAVRVRVQGAGGGGGGAPLTTNSPDPVQTSAGSGGEGGAYAESFLLAEDLSSSTTVTVGAGGSGGTGGAGSTGGTSSFGSHVSAAGGGGGSIVLAGTTFLVQNGQQTTQAMTGQIQVAGCSSQGGIRGGATGSLGGAGGASFLGGGARSTGTNTNGSNGKLYGGGGGGSGNNPGQSAKTGGTGANGVVIVELFY